MQAGGVDIWQVNEGARVTINGEFYGNVARDLYGYCGSRGGAVTVRWIYGEVHLDGSYIHNMVWRFLLDYIAIPEWPMRRWECQPGPVRGHEGRFCYGAKMCLVPSRLKTKQPMRSSWYID
jgi:hypothetical protein